MTDRELLELIAAQVGALTTEVGTLTTEVGSLTTRFDSLETKVDSIEADLKETKERVINIENDHGKKLDLLFDGYKQNADKLDRIEEEVSRHEEIILRRIK